MAPSRRRNNASLFESSTIITANLIMASSSYLLARFTPCAPAMEPEPTTKVVAATASTARPSALHTRSIEPVAGCRTVFMEPEDGEYSKVDKEAENFIRRFRVRTESEVARQQEAEAVMAASMAVVRPPQLPVTATRWAGTVHRYQR